MKKDKEFVDIQASIGCGFALESVRDMIRTYTQQYFLAKLLKT